MNHKLAAAGLAVGLLGGAAAGLALGVPGLAGAQSDSTTTTAPATTTAPSDGSGGERSAGRSEWMAEALAPLVSAGTITQAQADAVIEALEAAKPAGKGGGRHGGHGHGFASLTAAAEALGMTREELATELRDGKTIAEVAAEKGVDVQTVIDAMVSAAKERLAEAVSEGRITQEQADERLATLTDDITKVVNGELPVGPGRGPGHDGDESTTSTTEPTTSTTTS
jgi:hypothetical protein